VSTRIFHAESVPPTDEQSRKLGIWFSERMQAAVWRLSPGQRIVAHCHPNADSLTMVVSGTGSYLDYDGQTPDPAVCYVSKPDVKVVPPPPGDLGRPRLRPVQGGSVAVTGADHYFGLVNTGSDELVAVVVTAPDSSDSIYTVRTPPGSISSDVG
jgi:mannose-6-phosphate isomerase-like protein (cupin superfamily)